MYDTGRHDRHTAQHQQARRHLRQGIATVALQAKLSGGPELDCVGRPLQYANEMAERHSIGQIERWAKGWSLTAGKPSKRWCQTCRRAGRDPFQALEHGH